MVRLLCYFVSAQEFLLKIILTGTGASQNIPAFRCSCDVCVHARDTGMYRRDNSCAVIEPEKGGKILVDSPPQFLSQLASCSIDDRDIRSLLLTHRHDDHLLGLFYLFTLKKSKGAEIGKALEVYNGIVTGEYILKRFKALSDPVKLKQLEGVFNFNTVMALESFNIGSCRIMPLETNHLKMKSSDPLSCRDETLGFCFSERGKNFYYLVDAAETLPEETLSFMRANQPDCMVVDCTYREGGADSGHGDIESVLVLRKEFPEGRMIISHIGHTNHTPDILDTILSPEGIETGYDGMEIVI